jgi:hypothetical protein
MRCGQPMTESSRIDWLLSKLDAVFPTETQNLIRMKEVFGLRGIAALGAIFYDEGTVRSIALITPSSASLHALVPGPSTSPETRRSRRRSCSG